MTTPTPRLQELMAKFGAQWDADGSDWKDTGGCSYAEPFDMLQVKEFGFCGCGLVGGALPYARKGLRYIADRNLDNGDIATWIEHDLAFWAEWCKKDTAAQTAALGSEESAYFFFWWADDKGYTEHGSCLPGWLTDRGKALLELLDLLGDPE